MSQIDYIGSVFINPNSTGGAHTRSSYSQLIASTASAYSAFIVEFRSDLSMNVAFNFATGGSGSEVAIAEDICYPSVFNTDFRSLYVPVAVAASTRLAINVQYSVTTSNSATGFYVWGINTPKLAQGGVTKVKNLAFDSANTRSSVTLLGDSGTPNIDGAWIEVISSLPSDLCAIALYPEADNQTYTGVYLIDVGAGAAASEVAFLEDLRIRRRSGNAEYRFTAFFPYDVSSGTRIAARINSATTTAGARDVRCGFYAYLGTPTTASGGAGRLVGTGGLV